MDFTEVLTLLSELTDLQGQLEATDEFERLPLISRIIEIIEILTGEGAEDPDTNTEGTAADDDPQWKTDNAVLQQIISREHPRLSDPKFADDVLAIYERWKGDEAKLAVIVNAVNEWAKYAVELTAQF